MVVYLTADQIALLHRRAIEAYLAENQPFIDGNKRTAAAAMATFLALNGFDLLEQSETELAEVFERLGSRSIGQGEFFEWVANHVQPLDADGTDPEIDR